MSQIAMAGPSAFPGAFVSLKYDITSTQPHCAHLLQGQLKARFQNLIIMQAVARCHPILLIGVSANSNHHRRLRPLCSDGLTAPASAQPD